MNEQADIKRMIEQEVRLLFENFDEETALAIGLDIKRRVEAIGGAVAIDVRFWDRSLFTFSMRGVPDENAHWVQRKANSVKRFQRSSYRMMLERGGEEVMEPFWGLDFAEYVFAGGGFPIRVKGAGCIGAITISGLPARQDHAIVVAAICASLSIDYEELALPA
ncbi:MAG: heme-degrading domain-containing protein [Rhizobiaceae bacterium]|nr:heme-degrading domain-containing protein [Rhizobiaceae bacterium]